MKWSLILPAFLATLASGCVPREPVVTCYTRPLCDGEGGVIEDGSGTPISIQQCFTGAPIGRGGSCFGGGGSCICQDGAEQWCATVEDCSGNVLTLSRVNQATGATDTKTLTLVEFGFMGGEPHIKTWNGTWYDWHGECDAVMLSAPDFGYGKGLAIHTRTKIRYDYSFIETAAIQLGEDILEFSGFGQYFVNGVGGVNLPAILSSDYTLTHEVMDEWNHKFEIDLGGGASLFVKTHKDIVSAGINPGADIKWFESSSGLMGSYPGGEMLARDGVTLLNDPNAMGQEWQVRDTEPKLFMSVDHKPQYPEKCQLPSPTAKVTRRRLGETVSREAAEKACDQWLDEGSKERCMYDVMALGDLDMSTAGAY